MCLIKMWKYNPKDYPEIKQGTFRGTQSHLSVSGFVSREHIFINHSNVVIANGKS